MGGYKLARLLSCIRQLFFECFSSLLLSDLPSGASRAAVNAIGFSQPLRQHEVPSWAKRTDSGSLSGSEGDLVSSTLAECPSSNDGDILCVETNVQIPTVCGRCVGLEHRPRSLPIRSVDVQLGVATSSGDNSPVDASDGRPDVRRRAGRLISAGSLQGNTGYASESQGVATDLVVNGELVAAETGSATVLVSHHVLSVADLSHDRHSGSSGVNGVGDIIDNSAPCLATVGGYLVNHLLAIPRVSLRYGES